MPENRLKKSGYSENYFKMLKLFGFEYFHGRRTFFFSFFISAILESRQCLRDARAHQRLGHVSKTLSGMKTFLTFEMSHLKDAQTAVRSARFSSISRKIKIKSGSLRLYLKKSPQRELHERNKYVTRYTVITMMKPCRTCCSSSIYS